MFKDSYKKLFSKGVPDNLIKKTINQIEQYEKKSKKIIDFSSYKLKFAGVVAVALVLVLVMTAVYVFPLDKLNSNKDGAKNIENSFFMTASASEIDSTQKDCGAITLSSGSAEYGQTSGVNYKDKNNSYFFDYKLNFTVNGNNMMEITLDAKNFYISDSPFTGKETTENHKYKISNIHSKNDNNKKTDTVKISDLHYIYIADRNDKTVNSFLKKIEKSEEEEKHIQSKNRQQCGTSSFVTTAEEEILNNQKERYISDLHEYAYKNATIDVSVTFDDGTSITKTVFIDFYLSQSYSLWEEKNVSPVFQSLYENYATVTPAEKDISYSWITFKYFEKEKPDYVDKYRKIISASEMHKDMFGGYYVENNKLNILLTDKYAKGENLDFDKLLSGATIKRCKYTKAELVSALEKANLKRINCFNISTDYLNSSFRLDVKNNRLVCVISDDLNKSEATALKENIKVNVIKGIEKYFVFNTLKVE